MRVLLIEDNPKLAAALRGGLKEQGYVSEWSASGFEGEELAAASEFDAVILDLMLPDRDGLDVCRNLRRRRVSTSILVLTALSGTADKVAGLDAGADDYLVKPFEFDELLARLRALLRRGRASEARTLRYDDLELDLSERSARRAGHAIPLSPKEFALLEYFLRHTEQVLPRCQIVERVWALGYEPSSNVLDVYVSSLRKKIDRDFDRPLIHTVISTGYRFGLAHPRRPGVERR